LPLAKGEILVVTDTNVFFARDTLRRLMRWYADPRVGLVSGTEQRIQAERQQFQAETWYRDFDIVLKCAEGRMGATMGAYGGIYSLRATCWRAIPDETQNEDLATTLNVLRQGYATLHDSEALAEEAIGANPDMEFGRRIRIGAGNFQCLAWNLWLLNPLQGWKSLFFWFHKVPRWFTPHLLIVALATHLALALRGHLMPWLALHLALYAVGLYGIHQNRRGLGRGWVSALGHFLHMNAAVGLGFIRWLRGIRAGTWTPTRL
jgi:cellulose synthase/poly-beta-1,6-N-acetylglucosamine synthase-like glycosyltransferase